MTTLYRPELLYSAGTFQSNCGLMVDDDGKVQAVCPKLAELDARIVDLPGKALLPGFVNAHSHAFQRLIRGKSESRNIGGSDFWSWRRTMYRAGAHLSPEYVYDVSRMAFLEMLASGITSVGEFHYLHRAPDGSRYDDPNLLGKQVIAAAQSVGIRIVLLRTAYLRAGYELPPDPGQRRFYEFTHEFLENMEALIAAFPSDSDHVRLGVAPHSVRAVPLGDLKQIVDWGRSRKLPLHMHLAEQIAENEASRREHGTTPVALLSREGLLGADLTAVHAIHVTHEEIGMLAEAGATICSCPTTERNLGDGIVTADRIMERGISIALGSDSQAQIDPLEDARELDYHLRLQDQQRAILDQIGGRGLAARLFDCATVNGARALGLPAGEFVPGSYADFFTVALDDLSIAGNSPEDLLAILVFALNRTAIRDVAVAGNLVIRDRLHASESDIVSRYQRLHGKVWRS
jgi:formimidoylglutamate deiminase